MKRIRETKDRKLYRQFRTCTNKKAFSTYAEAEQGKGRQSSYMCPYCGKIHRTSKLSR